MYFPVGSSSVVVLFVLFMFNVAQNVLESQWFWGCCGHLWKGLQVQKCSTVQILCFHVRLRDSEFQINGSFYFQLSWVISDALNNPYCEVVCCK